METLVVVTQHRNQYYCQRKYGVASHFVSSPTRGFGGMNCRSYEFHGRILPPPSKICASFNNHHEPKSQRTYLEPSKRSNPIAIEEFSYSELWAGPAYSNSPPPSSLPIPKFSLRQKRSVSLESPLTSSEVELPYVCKSAPSSPTRDFFSSAAEDLRRILHLDIADD